ncbi:anti-sigma factor [Novosphingobium nitrogenifigens DSM 19370]|uniref:Anti-sigma factor n=1 Tax=Novosphingobium nitrogenifigens DSM 19370 TaxID=983920 RepID=F1Z6M0_9SPHN|nr:hypothetical protein [Novosphingobium nitrogenifigens]EGD59680.1 anti-sigma factor [Novosphingobium nitrogenifigens DSM 19370]
MTVTPEEIMAYVDDELDTPARERVTLAALADPALAERIAAERAVRDSLRAHFAKVDDEPLPAEWVAMIRSSDAPTAPTAQVHSLDEARARRTPAWRQPVWFGAAIAASLVLGLFAGTRITSPGPIVTRGGALVAGGELAGALDHQLASANAGAPVQILGSFRRGDGSLCRVFSGRAASGIACRAQDAWQLQHVLPGTQETGTAYRQAGSAQAELMELAQQMATGDPLDAAQEQAAMNEGWRGAARK